METLLNALSSFLDADEATDELAEVLSLLSEKGHVSYSDVAQVCPGRTEDVILIGWKWRLMLPIRSSRCSEWDDRILSVRTGEVYEMPNVARYLVKNAIGTGEWDSYSAVTDLYRVMGNPAWQQMAHLVERICDRVVDSSIDARDIGAVCRDLGLGDRVDSLIAVLKGGGVISPKLLPLAEVTRKGVPIYEVNPCLFPQKG
jgi:hypothetical protein